MQSANQVHGIWRSGRSAGHPAPGLLRLPLGAPGRSGRCWVPVNPRKLWLSRWRRKGSPLDEQASGALAARRAASRGPTPRAGGRDGQKPLARLSRKRQHEPGGRGSPPLPIQPRAPRQFCLASLNIQGTASSRMCFLLLRLPETPRMEKQRPAARFLGSTRHLGSRESWREEG